MSKQEDQTVVIHYSKASMTLPDGMSIDDLRACLADACRDKLGAGSEDGNGPYVYVREIFADRLVATKSGTEYQYFMMTWSIDAARVVTLGDPVEVQEVRHFVPMSKAAERWQAPAAGLFDGIVL